jgi:hypothetical protein
MGVAAVPWILAATTVASTAVSIFSGIQRGKDIEQEQTRLAAESRKAAAQKAADTEKEHRRIIAAQEARYGASGLTMEGSPLLVKQESLKESKEQLRRIIESGENMTTAYTATGKEAATSGYVGAAQSAVSGVESLHRIGASYDWW